MRKGSLHGPRGALGLWIDVFQSQVFEDLLVRGAVVRLEFP